MLTVVLRSAPQCPRQNKWRSVSLVCAPMTCNLQNGGSEGSKHCHSAVLTPDLAKRYQSNNKQG